MENTVKLLNYTRQEMLEDWKLRKGLALGRTDCTVVRDDGVDLDALLLSEIDCRYELLLAEAPPELLPVADIAEECVMTVADDLTASISLPERCVRVLEVKLIGWKVPVSAFFEPDSEMARRQSSEWLRGRSECPVWVARRRSIDAYSAASRADLVPEWVVAVIRPDSGNYVFAPLAWKILLER